MICMATKTVTDEQIEGMIKTAVDSATSVKKKKRSSKKVSKIPRHLTETEVHDMFQLSIRSRTIRDRDEKILKLLYYFGLRNNEMCRLQKKHILLDQMILKVVQGKGNKDRYIPIIDLNPLLVETTTIFDDLKKWLSEMKEDDVLVQGDCADGSISDRTVRRIVKNYAAWIKVPKWEEIHPHTLRHSYGTHIRNMGVPLEVIQRLLGHSKIETTLIYAHAGVEDLRSTVKKHVSISKVKKEIPALLADINSEKNAEVRVQKQNDLIIKGLLVMLGITPDE